ncbi:hypothetical protein RZN32_28645 [Klebsiella pneumoniae]|nr:hypothetical protein [Klebsiella pneumoniae]
MFTAFNERNDFSYAFEKIRNAISAPGENNLFAASDFGLGFFFCKWEEGGQGGGAGGGRGGGGG